MGRPFSLYLRTQYINDESNQGSGPKCKNATEHLPQGRIQGICHRLFVFYLVTGEPCGHGPMRLPISRSMKPVHSGSPI